MQSSREVVESLMRHRTAERMGVVDFPWADTLQGWIKQGYPVEGDGEPVSPVDHFNFDLASCGEGFPWKARLVPDVVVEEADEWKLVRDGNGALLRWWKRKSGTPEHVSFDMSSRSTWEREYRLHVVGSARSRVTPQLVQNTRKDLLRWQKKGKWTYFSHRFVWENLRGSLGDLCLYEAMLLQPEWIQDYCRVYTDLYKECFAILLDEGGLPDGVWLCEDLGYKGSLFCSPALYSRLIFPYFREMVSFFHSYGLVVVLHTCGLAEPILPHVLEAGFDALHPMEVKAGNDPLRIASKYGDRLALIGGLDARVLESGDRRRTEKEVTKLTEGMKSRGAPYIFSSDHSLSTHVDYRDFCFALKTYRDHAAYRRQVSLPRPRGASCRRSC